MEDNNNIVELNLLEENNYNFNINPNIIYKEELTDDCNYEYYRNNFYFDVYNLKFEKEKIFICFISKKEKNNIKILETHNNNKNIILTLKDHKNNIISLKHFFNQYSQKDYLLSIDSKANVLLYEIISTNEYKLKHKIDSKSVRNKRWTCSIGNQPPFGRGIGCIYNRYNNPFVMNPMTNPMNNIFGRKKFGMFNDFNYDFEQQILFQEPAFVIDYIDSSLLFFTSNNNYIFILYRESASLAIFDLENLESKGRIYDQSSVNSLVQWFNSNDKINYIIISGNGKIEILNPFLDKNRIYHSFKDNDNLKGGNYAYSILYNFRDNNDFLLSYTKYKINIINLNIKNIIFTIEIKNNINSVLAWNKKYLIVSEGDNYGKNKFAKLLIIHIDSKKSISSISEDCNSIKSGIKKLVLSNNNIHLYINDSENKIKLWKIKNE